MGKGIVSWFAQNGVAANLLMIIIIVSGALTIPFLKKEIFPEYAVDIVTVQVRYLGAAPEEVEEGVCVRVEEAIQDLDVESNRFAPRLLKVSAPSQSRSFPDTTPASCLRT